LASNKKRPIHIGNNVKIMQGVIISTAQKGKVCIGNDVYIGEYSVITSNGEIIIEDNVMIAPHNNIVDFDHEFNDLGTVTSQVSFLSENITIKNGAWVASNCCILKGITIGEKATVGAGSVVTKDVPACSVAAGNPAKVIKRFK
jgi:acetyltransferase-like isoleucine patch superfamily enzyme